MSLSLDLEPAVGENELGSLVTVRTNYLDGEKTVTLFIPEPPTSDDDP